MAPKANLPELKTFLTSPKRDFFCSTKQNDVKDNLSEEEKNAFEKWRKDVLFNKESELEMRLQRQSNRFVIVDKETDKIKAEQQIVQSSFQELNHDPTK